MPVHLARRGTKWAVVDDEGKVHGTHERREEAIAQMAAINNAIHRKEHGRGFLPALKKRKR